MLNLTTKENFQAWLQFLRFVPFFWASVLLIQFLIRLAMYFLFGEAQAGSEYYSYLPDAFLMGLRFDFGVANYLLSPMLLLSFVLVLLRSRFLWMIFEKLSFYWLLFGFLATSFLSICNLTFYHYFKDHFNLLVFGLWEDDTVALVKSLWENEPILWELLLLSILVYLSYRSFRYFYQRERKLSSAGFFKRAIFYVASFLVIGFGARGTFNLNMHPLHRMHTEISPYYFLNQLSFSPIYALGDALILGVEVRRKDYDLIESLGYKNNIKAAYGDLLGIDIADVPEDPMELLKYNSGKKTGKAPHVVVIAMESWGSFWLEFDSDEYPILGKMKKHIGEDVFNLKFLPSGSGTYPSVTHWLLNMGTLPGVAAAEKYINKDYITSAVKPFLNAGYETHYMYGGGLGWRNLSPFLYQLGFQELHGETKIKEFLGSKIETHPWGVFDEDLFSYLEQHLEKAQKPQLVFVLSTTNHPPFHVPSDYPEVKFEYPEKLQSRMTKASKTLQERLRAYRYSMDSLGNFMSWVKEGKKNIIVAASGDHSFYESVKFDPSDSIEWYGVPLYLYSSIVFDKKTLEGKFGSHANIFPTVYDLALDNQDYYALNPSLLRGKTSMAVSSVGFATEEAYFNQYKVYPKKSQTKPENYFIKLWKAYYAVAADMIQKSPTAKAGMN